MFRHTITEKDNVLTWTETKEKKIFILSGGKTAKEKKQKTEKECTTKNE